LEPDRHEEEEDADESQIITQSDSRVWIATVAPVRQKERSMVEKTKTKSSSWHEEAHSIVKP
jgi:hypothetical protein